MGVRWRAYVPAGRQVRSEAPPWPSFVLYFVLMGELGIQHGLWDPVPLQLRHRNSKMSLDLIRPFRIGCLLFLQPHSAVVLQRISFRIVVVTLFKSFWYCNFFLGTASGTAIRWQWNVRPEFLIYYRHLDRSYSSVLNYSLVDFFISDLTTCLIQNFVQNITFSIVICFINTNSSKVA